MVVDKVLPLSSEPTAAPVEMQRGHYIDIKSASEWAGAATSPLQNASLGFKHHP